MATYGPIGIVYKGAYNADTTYSLLNTVFDNGSTYMYRALESSKGNPLPILPEVSNAYWTLLAQRGDNVELRVNDTAIQWQLEGTNDWQDLVVLSTLKGETGATGPQGAKGDKGETGMTGPEGPQGDVGATPQISVGDVTIGENVAVTVGGTAEKPVLSFVLKQGPKGEKGDRGDTGTTPKLSIGAVEKGEAAAATLTGTAEAPVLNLVLPKGDQGEKGDAGPAGPKGDTGVGVASFERTAGTGRPGTTDVYTIAMTDGTSATIEVYNGEDGQGVGDMKKSDYDADDDGVVDLAAEAQALADGAVVDVVKLRDYAADNTWGGEAEGGGTRNMLDRLFYFKSDQVSNANAVVRTGAYGVKNTDESMPYKAWWYLLVFCKNEEMGVATQWAFQVRPEGNGEFWMRTIRVQENYYGSWVRIATKDMLDTLQEAMESSLNSKADVNHSHPMNAISDLIAALDAKADVRSVTDHVSSVSNPHSVTAAQVGARPDTWLPTPAQIGAASVRSLTVSLANGGWINQIQTIAVSNLDPNKDDVIVSPAPVSHIAYSMCGARCELIDSGRLTFRCDSIPEENLDVNLLIVTGG